jgi:Domain of unknown function (DUF397)
MPTHIPPGVAWRRSSRSNGDGNVCVEVAFLGDRAAVRDSKDPGSMIEIPANAWRRLRRTITNP